LARRGQGENPHFDYSIPTANRYFVTGLYCVGRPGRFGIDKNKSCLAQLLRHRAPLAETTCLEKDI
jgi:hypothetical protein